VERATSAMRGASGSWLNDATQFPVRPTRAAIDSPSGRFIPLASRTIRRAVRIATLMLYRARIALLLFSALSAHMVPACGRSFGHGVPVDRDVARAGYRSLDFFSQTSQVTWPISSSSNGYPASLSASLICP
jgi:hypothetical protein